MLTTTVLIVGAGPTGLALACGLRHRGVDVQVLDRSKSPATTTRALGVQPRGRQILDRLGALDSLLGEAVPETDFDVYVNGRHALHVNINVLGGPDDDGPLRVSQTLIERSLRERLRQLGVEVQWDHEVVGADEGPEGISATVRTSTGMESVRAKWLVGCDGAHSTVRKAIGASFEGTAYPETFLLGDVSLNRGRESGAAIYLKNDQILTMATLPGGTWRIGVALPPGDPLAERGREAMTAERDKSATDLKEGLTRLQHLFSEYLNDDKTLLFDPTWFSVFRINRRMASSFRRGRLLIAGDAAHLTSPLGGQGMNTGLSDAFNLSWKLAFVVQGRVGEDLLDTYEGERRPATEKIERATTQWTNILLGEGWLNRALRRYVMLPAMKFRSVQRWVLTRRPALQSSYRGGPLAARGHGRWLNLLLRRGPQSGDEAPDPRCRFANTSKVTSLGHEVGPNWGLLLFDSIPRDIEACVDAAQSRLGDDLRVFRIMTESHPGETHEDRLSQNNLIEDYSGAIAQSFRPDKGTAILVRPDGYIAWRSSDSDIVGLTSWLDNTLRITRAGIPIHD